MNEMTTGTMGLASMGISAVLIVLGFIIWFFVNRASVRANQQIQLLEALLEEQKKQNAMLLRLTNTVSGSDKNTAQPGSDSSDFIRMIPER